MPKVEVRVTLTLKELQDALIAKARECANSDAGGQLIASSVASGHRQDEVSKLYMPGVVTIAFNYGASEKEVVAAVVTFQRTKSG